MSCDVSYLGLSAYVSPHLKQDADCNLEHDKSMSSSKILECFLLAFIIALDSIDLLMCNIDWLYPALATRAPRKDVNSCCELYSRRTNAL